MRYLVVSDNHGDRDILVDLVDRYRSEVDIFFHCGDSELEASDPLWDTFQVVQGNCDYGPGFEQKSDPNWSGYSIHDSRSFIECPIWFDTVSNRSSSCNCRYGVFGHTHQIGCEMDQKILF